MQFTLSVHYSEKDKCFVAELVDKLLMTHGETAGEAVEELIEVMSTLLPEELEKMLED